MTAKEQCEIARLMTGCSDSDSEILRGVATMNILVKEEASLVVNKLLIRDDLPFDKAYHLMKGDFERVAQKYKISSASLFWVYMEWKGGQKNEG